MMNEFYKDLMGSYVYHWLMGQQNVSVCQNHQCTLWVDRGDIYGVISFHQENIVELSVKKVKDDEVLFYLHFQMHDMHSSLCQFQTFFQYLAQPFQEKSVAPISTHQVSKILLSCSGGLTTSYFAYSIQNIFQQKQVGIQVDAVGYSDIDQVADDYDLILLAPQIAYMLPQFQKTYGHKVMTIEAMDFATQNFEGIIQKALHERNDEYGYQNTQFC